VVTLLRESARPAAIREHRLAPWFAVGTVCFGAFMGQLDASVVTVAFPALQRQFGAGLAAVQWVSLAYLLALTTLLVPAGRWSDRAGRKLLYLYGFVVFAAASAGCGLATSIGLLIALRLVQAVGAAMLQANSVALVVTSMPARKRRAALGVQAAAQAVGLASGPVLGGLIVAAVGWRWVFFLNVPVGVIAVAAGVFLLPRTRRRAESRGTDPAGMVLLAVSTTAGMLAISSLSGLGMPAWAVASCAAGAVVAAAALWCQERRSAAGRQCPGGGPAAHLTARRVRGRRRARGPAASRALAEQPPLCRRRRARVRLRRGARGARAPSGIGGAARPARGRPWRLYSGEQRRDHDRAARQGRGCGRRDGEHDPGDRHGTRRGRGDARAARRSAP
jgi:hypothetical protein